MPKRQRIFRRDGADISGLAEADLNGDGVVDVLELAQYIDRKVPELTESAWHLRQVPQIKIVGSNFPLAMKTALISGGKVIPVVTVPNNPTHVVIAPVSVRRTASGTAALVVNLAPGTQVRLIGTAGGWVLIAREGKKLGYVEAKALAMMQ